MRKRIHSFVHARVHSRYYGRAAIAVRRARRVVCI